MTGKRSRNRPGTQNSVPSSAAIKYSGRIIKHNLVTDGVTVNLHSTAAVSTNGAGLAFAYLSNDPSSSSNWTEYSTIWNEYRVLGINIHYVPFIKVNYYSGSLNIQDAPMIVTTLHTQSAPTPGTYTAAFAYGDPKISSLMTQNKQNWRMTSVAEAQFSSTGSPTSTVNTYLYYAEGNPSVDYGRLFLTYLVQFRSQRQ